MMLNTWRGLMLAAGVAAIPAFAQAECPPRDSIDRYAQTARDALVALDGLVPEEQQSALENRYIAMSILRWSYQGRDAILNEPSAVDGITNCINSGTCDALDSERSGAGPRIIAPFPSDRLVGWANRQLECGASVAEQIEDTAESAPPIEGVETALSVEPETDTAPISDATSEAEPLESDSGPIEEEQPLSDLVATDPPEAEFPVPAEIDVVEEANAPEESIVTGEPSEPALGEISVASGNDEHLIRAAVLLMLNGNISGSIQATSQACYQAAETADPVQTCEMLFDHYDRLAVRADPIEYLAFTDQLCRVNYARGCSGLATYFGVETTTEAQLAALRFYDRSCNSGDAEACAAASDYFLTGRAERADPVRARDTLYRSCDLGRLSSCQPLAEFFARGVGGEVDLDRAIELNDISCSTDQTRSAETCVAAADFVLLNLQDGEERDTKVRTYMARACRIGHDIGCALHADNLEFGIGGTIDLEGAEQARQRACQLGHEASCDAAS